MYGFEQNEGIIIIAATNRPDVLDKALLRPGRFDRQIVVDTPTLDGRDAILKIHTKEMSIAKGIDYKKIAAETEGLSGADLRALSVEAGMNAIKNKRVKINYKDFTEALDKVKNRLNDAEISEPEGGLYY